MRVAYHKLVRDKIPAIIQAAGHQPMTGILDERGYQAALLAKLIEEAHEAHAAPAEDLPSELADALEVLQALVAAQNLTWDELLSLAACKRARRGGWQPGPSCDRRPTHRQLDRPGQAARAGVFDQAAVMWLSSVAEPRAPGSAASATRARLYSVSTASRSRLLLGTSAVRDSNSRAKATS
jgi:predicted house-cleaning noncanonical NTP pyrophosphatase (MazG superfamily)